MTGVFDMRPLYLAKEDLGDKKFKITLSDKHKSQINSDEEATSFELMIDNGNLKKMDVAYNGEKKMSMDFFDGPMGPVMNYHLLDEGLDLSDQLRLGITQYLQPGLHYLDRISDEYMHPRIFHRYSDGAGICIFYNPYDQKHPITVGLNEVGSHRIDYTSFDVNAKEGLVERKREFDTGLEVKRTNNIPQPNEKKHDIREMQKMAILVELDKPNTFQQREVSAAPQFQMSAGNGCRG